MKFLKHVRKGFDQHECFLRAASLAYYALFSIIPLLLFLIYLGGELLTSESAQKTLEIYLDRVLPVSAIDLQKIIDQALLVRGPIGILGGIGLAWSASSVFGVLEWSLSKIWSGTPSSFWRRRLLAGVAVMVLSVLFIASFSLRPLVDWLWADDDLAYKNWINLSLGFGGNTAISFLLFRIFPNRDVAWKSALVGALFVGATVEFTRSIFLYFLGLAFTNFGYIYGSLAWIAALGLWVYIVGVILFFGAEVGATFDKRTEIMKADYK